MNFVGVIFACRWVEDCSRWPSHCCNSNRLIGYLVLNGFVAIVDRA
jgi:hypothetical protein